MTAFKNKSAAHTVNGSTGGRWEQVFKGLVCVQFGHIAKI